MKKVLYFAYGSNLLKSRLERRVGWKNSINIIKTHRLEGWKLVFNAESDVTCTNYANIQKGTPTDFVEGVLYDITPEQYKLLDHYEALYNRYYFSIDEDTLGCTYICDNQLNLRQKFTPDLAYLSTIMEGAIDNNLDATYYKIRDLILKIDFNFSRRPKNFKDY